MMTGVGVLLGTAAYMSPEQARGKAADRRTDIWAFGCVLFEMLTGKQAFAASGDTVSDAVAAILRAEPDWSALPDDTPPFLRRLLRRCLQKDLHERLPHIGVARLEIDEERLAPTPTRAQTTEAASRAFRYRILAWAAASVVFAAAVFGAMYMGRETQQASPYRASILAPPNAAWSGTAPATRFFLSPDGRRLAFMARQPQGRTQIWVRSLDSTSAQPLAGTEGAVIAAWSPDSRFLAFVAAGKLRKIDASGGPALAPADATSDTGLSWSVEDVILFSRGGGSPLFRVAASGGMPAQVTTLDAAAGTTGHRMPFFLPDGRHFLYQAVGSNTDMNEAPALYVGSLDTAEKARLIMESGSNAQYAAGHLLFMRDTALMAQPFDPDRVAPTGEAMPLAAQVQIGGATGRNGAFSVSAAGVMVYQTGSTEITSQLVWMDRSGRALGTVGDPGDQTGPELSPDGSRALASVIDATRTPPGRDLWVYDLRRGLRTRFHFRTRGRKRCGLVP